MIKSLYIGLVIMLLPLQSAIAGNIVVLGDSISAAYQMEQDEGWVALLQSKLKDEYTTWHVINESISGETTAGGLSRLPEIMDKHSPTILVIELGGNDGLRGLSPQQMRSNLATMITMAKEKNTQVLLCGVRLPPNYGPAFNQIFQKIYLELAEKHVVDLIQQLLDDIDLDAGLMQADGIHPNEKAQPIIAERVYTALQKIIEKLSAGTTSLEYTH